MNTEDVTAICSILLWPYEDWSMRDDPDMALFKATGSFTRGASGESILRLRLVFQNEHPCTRPRLAHSAERTVDVPLPDSVLVRTTARGGMLDRVLSEMGRHLEPVIVRREEPTRRTHATVGLCQSPPSDVLIGRCGA